MNTLVNLIKYLEENNTKNLSCNMHVVSLPREVNTINFCKGINCTECIFDPINNKLLPEVIKNE